MISKRENTTNSANGRPFSRQGAALNNRNASNFSSRHVVHTSVVHTSVVNGCDESGGSCTADAQARGLSTDRHWLGLALSRPIQGPDRASDSGGYSAAPSAGSDGRVLDVNCSQRAPTRHKANGSQRVLNPSFRWCALVGVMLLPTLITQRSLVQILPPQPRRLHGVGALCRC